MPDIRRRTIEGLRPGDTFTVVRTFDEEVVDAFGHLSRDYNPVHYDRRFAETKGFGDLIAHGLLVGALVTEIGGQIGWLATGMSFRFLKPVFRRDTVSCQLTIDEIDERGRARATARLTNQHGTLVIEATLAGHLPVGPSRDVLATMVAEGDPTNRG